MKHIGLQRLVAVLVLRTLLVHVRPALRDTFTVLLITIGTAFFSATNACARTSQAAKISVLVYHDIRASDESPATPLAVRLSLFKQQMRYLSENGYRTLTLSELEDYLEGKRASENKLIALHFDDGNKSMSEVLPILSQYGFKASFSIVPGAVGFHQVMNWADISKISADPRYDILSHTMTHSCTLFGAYDGKPGKASEKAEFELAESRRIISEKIGKQVSALVWPCTEPNSASAKLATRIGYTSLFVLDGHTNYVGGGRLNIHRIPISGYCGMKDFAKMVSDGVGILCAQQKEK